MFLFCAAKKIHGQVFKIKCSKTFYLDNHIVPFPPPYGVGLSRATPPLKRYMGKYFRFSTKSNIGLARVSFLRR